MCNNKCLCQKTPSSCQNTPSTKLETNTLSLVSFIFGLLSWFLMPFLCIVAIVTGHMARQMSKDKLSLWGLILGYSIIVAFIVACIAGLILVYCLGDGLANGLAV